MSKFNKETALKILKQVAIAFAFLSLAVFYYQCVRNINKFDDIDLTSYIRASEWFFGGENPYQEISRRFIYPLFLLNVMYPFHWCLQSPLGKTIAAGFWSLGLYLSFFLALAANWKRIYRHDSLREALGRNKVTIAVMVLVLHPSLQDEFLNGQVNLFVMGAMAAFFIFTERDKPGWAGFFLAIATAIKIAPAVCLLYLLLNGRYRAVLYFIPILIFFVIGLPLLINPHSLEYYRYFVAEVMPHLTISEFEAGFRSFSLISTIGYLFNIHWWPPLKIAAIGFLTSALFVPILLIARKNFDSSNYLVRFTGFAAIVSIIPLTFPMSEAHHLLLQVIPLIAVIAYWKKIIDNGQSLISDRLSLLFIGVALGLNVGHGFKDTPIRLMSLIGLYVGMIWLLKKPALAYKRPSGKKPNGTIDDFNSASYPRCQ